MDPNYFVLDYHRLTDVLLAIILFSLFLERALSVVFEYRLFIQMTDAIREWRTRSHYYRKSQYILATALSVITSKEFISLFLAVSLCIICHLDAFTILLVSRDCTTLLGEIVTAGIVAGGSKVSIKLFRDVFKIMSTAEKERLIEKKKEAAKDVKSSGPTPYDQPKI